MIPAEETIVEEIVELPENTQAQKEPDTEPEVQEGMPDEQKQAYPTTEKDVGEETAKDQEGQQQTSP
ncbi:hypothetical protein RF55_18172, partial [Lasius niger]